VFSLTCDNVVTEVSLRTLECERMIAFSTEFRRHDIMNKVILKVGSPLLSFSRRKLSFLFQSSILKEIFSDIDWSNETLSLLMSPNSPFFQISTDGPSGSCQVNPFSSLSIARNDKQLKIQLPYDAGSSDIFIEFECTQTQQFW
jgi:hypothetical protein